MADATSKIRIRLGQVEIEYEGAHDFLSQDLPKLLQTVVELREKTKDTEDAPDDDDKEPKKKVKASGGVKGTVAAIAAKLGAKKGPDLIIAAAAKLTLGEGKNSFSRDELITAMKSATSYYKKTYLSNLSNYLKVLLSANRLTEPATDHYTLTATEVDQLKAKLGE